MVSKSVLWFRCLHNLGSNPSTHLLPTFLYPPPSRPNTPPPPTHSLTHLPSRITQPLTSHTQPGTQAEQNNRLGSGRIIQHIHQDLEISGEIVFVARQTVGDAGEAVFVVGC